MEPGVLAALIAAVAGLGTSIWSVSRQARSEERVTQLQQKYESEVREEARKQAAKEQLDRFRAPLLAAAEDLAERIRNIRERGFLSYLQAPDESRRRIALLGTLYRLGKYWATVESLHQEANALRFETEESSRAVARLLNDIGTAFASDGMDAGRLMFWKEEQRAVAELMRPNHLEKDELSPVMGFASFVAVYDERFAPWLSTLSQSLQDPEIARSRRLGEVQRLLDLLHVQLKVAADSSG